MSLFRNRSRNHNRNVKAPCSQDLRPFLEKLQRGAKGLHLMEVYNIIYRGHHNLKPEEQLGTIKADDGLYDQYLYKVTDVDTSKPTIKTGDEVILSGPKLASISCIGPTIINFDLFCGAFTEEICIDSFQGTSGYPREKRIISDDGTAQIYVLYAQFYDATEAHIEVKLFTGSNSAADVHGAVAARTNSIQRPVYSSILFVKIHDYKIKVGHGELIPLSRSIIAVEIEQKLFLDIYLCSGDEEIYKDTISFDAKRSGTSQGTLHCKNDEIKVKVTWKGTVTALQGN